MFTCETASNEVVIYFLTEDRYFNSKNKGICGIPSLKSHESIKIITFRSLTETKETSEVQNTNPTYIETKNLITNAIFKNKYRTFQENF